MPVYGEARQLVKRAVSVARLKLLYERITLTRFTTLYFFCIVLTCATLSSLHIASLTHNSEAVSILSEMSSMIPGLAILSGNKIKLCSDLPEESGTRCMEVITFEDGLGRELVQRTFSLEVIDKKSDVYDAQDDRGDNDDGHRGLSAYVGSSTMANSSTTSASPYKSHFTHSRRDHTSGSPTDSDPTAVSAPDFSSDGLEQSCIISLKWLNDALHDAQREDVVIFLFQIWLFVLSFVAVFNESIPHLGTALLGNMLSTGWAGYRVYSTRNLMCFYRDQITAQACSGRDFLGDWWENRIEDAIALVALNGAALLVMAYLSFKLFKVYTTQTLERVGASPKVYQIYKLVLIFTIFLQLSGFMTIASTAIWIDKVVNGSLAELAKHTKSYLTAFILTLALCLPWLRLGWTCVRRECQIRFTVFCLTSAFLLAISIGMFYSELYRYVFSCWPFFATITITTFIFMAGTTFLGVLCRLNFGHGLANYIQVHESLEVFDFTPVYFLRKSGVDVEKSGHSVLERRFPDLTRSHILQYPVPLHASQ